MAKSVLLGLFLLYAAFALLWEATAGENSQRAVRSETLLRTGSSWDGEPYKSYPAGRPELSILKITLAPHTKLEWHSHPIPNAAYIVSGELTLERKKDGKKQQFAAGQLDRQFLRPLTHFTGEWREMSLLYSSSFTPEVQACLSFSIFAAQSAHAWGWSRPLVNFGTEWSVRTK